MTINIPAIEQAQQNGITIGVVPDGGKTALRLEIDDLLKDTELANLYLLALDAAQKDSTPWSYYEISGIHGYPQRPWNEVNNGFNGFGGYCVHGRPNFPTWHRVYLAQYEQALFLQAKKLAPALGAQAVLERFRVPYFDPFRPRIYDTNNGAQTVYYGVPVILTLPRIRVKTTAGGQYEEVANPLYSFTLKNNGTEVGIRATVRSGISSNQNRFNHISVRDVMDSDYNPRSGQDWMDMSNHYANVVVDSKGDPVRDRNGNSQQIRPSASLESWHDNVHGQFGGSMNSPATAGFDPSFWLHHCNVDRLLAIWQGLRSGDPSDSTKWWSRSEVYDPTRDAPESPLYPFRKVGSTRQSPKYWNSNETRDHRKMGYDYPETAAALASGNVVASLRSWANSNLGTSGTGVLPFDQQEENVWWASRTLQVPFWPVAQNRRIDGTTSYANMFYLGSNPQVPAIRAMAMPAVAEAKPMLAAAAHAPQAKPMVAAADASDSKKVEGSAKNELAHASAPPPQPAANVAAFHQEIMKTSISAKSTTVEKRCGAGHKLVSHDKMTQWEVCFVVDKFCLDGSFRVIFFLGDFTETQTAWGTEHNIAGSSYIFASGNNSVEHGCDNCKEQKKSGMKYGDAISLTDPLLTYYQSGKDSHGHSITSLAPEVVVPFLRRELHWRVVKANGEEVPRENVPSLKIGVYSETVRLPSDISGAPTFEDRVLQYGVTNGRPNGLNDGEAWS